MLGPTAEKQIKKSAVVEASLRMPLIPLMRLSGEFDVAERNEIESQYSIPLNAECGARRAARTRGEQRILGSGGSVGAGDEDLASAGEGEIG
jgi:hypothetical protein